MKHIISGKRVLVTGAAGFIGANLANRLLNQNYKVHALVKNETSMWRLANMRNDIYFHHTSLLDKGNITTLIRKINPHIIIHLAAYGSAPTQRNEDKILQTNIIGTFNLLNACLDINFDIFINTGTSTEYGIVNSKINENVYPKPLSLYGASKVSATILCELFARAYKKKIITIRPFSVYGPYEEKIRFIPTIIRSLIEQKEIQLTKETIRRDFIYIDDLINAYINAINYQSYIKHSIYNIGSGVEHTNKQVVQTLFKVTNLKSKLKIGAFAKRKWDTTHCVSDISLAKKDLKWQPINSLDQGLLKTYNWFLVNSNLYGTKQK